MIFFRAQTFIVKETNQEHKLQAVQNKLPSLEAFPMNDGWTRFIVFLFADPHLLERRQRRQNRSADPDAVFPLGRRDDLDFHGGRSESGHLLLHTISNAGEHGASTRKNRISVEILSNIDVAFHDGIVARLVNTGRFHAEECGLEERLGAPEALVTDRDHLPVRKLVALLDRRTRRSGRHFLFEIERDVGEFLLDVAHDFAFGRRRERVAAFGENFHEIIG